jgi:hypothetical protein
MERRSPPEDVCVYLILFTPSRTDVIKRGHIMRTLELKLLSNAYVIFGARVEVILASLDGRGESLVHEPGNYCVESLLKVD